MYVATSLFHGKVYILKSRTLKSAPSSFLAASNKYFQQNPASAWNLQIPENHHY